MREQTLIPLSEAIPSNKIFAYMSQVSFIPSPEIADYLDSEYFFNHSGQKQVSPLVENWSDQSDWEEGGLETKLASVILNRYKVKWQQLFTRYSELSTLNLLNNINVVKETEYGKVVSKNETDTLTKTGQETHTLGGQETRTESFPQDRKTTREITGGWKDTDTTSTTRTGLQDVTESFSTQSPRTSTKTTTGGYSDTDTTSNTRTGTQTVTDRGNTLTGVYGFNSSSSVPSSVVGPEGNGITQETSYGTGLRDAKSGSVTRSYGENGLTETTTEAGSKTLSTSYGENGLKDENAGNIQRLYENYKDEVKETGSKQTITSYGPGGKTDELSFANRSDTHSIIGSDTNSGTDSETETGYRYDNLIEQYLTIFMSAEYLDFLAIVYDDCDEILTCPYFV